MSSKPRALPQALRQRGVTLIEMILFMVIVGVALAGIVGVMALTTRQSADPVRRKQALILAEGLLEEVERANFSYCDPTDPKAPTAANSQACTIPEDWGQKGSEPAASGRPYDNVNDYFVPDPQNPNAANATFDAGGKLSDANGNALNLDGYSATVKITPVAIGPDTMQVGAASPSAGVSTASTADNEALQITVTITYDGQTLTLDGYRTRYAPNAL
jgi:MSHA pilin protein MshD